jgi:hypothetical protein
VSEREAERVSRVCREDVDLSILLSRVSFHLRISFSRTILVQEEDDNATSLEHTVAPYWTHLTNFQVGQTPGPRVSLVQF